MSPFSLEPQPDQPKPLIESLEARLLCARGTVGFIRGVITIAPPSGALELHLDHSHPAEGVIGLNTAEAKSDGVVTWDPT
jgi:hypothetical protein